MADIALLKKIGKVTHFSKDQTVFMQDDRGDDMYIVLAGVFGVYINSFSSFPIRVAGISQASFFGEMSVIDGSPRSATIVAEEDGAVMVVDKSNFGVLLENAPDIADSILNTLRNRVRSTTKSVAETGKKAPEMPQELETAKYKDVNSCIAHLTSFAALVRDMNALLAVSEESEPPPEEIAKRTDETITLLPEGYIPFNLGDDNDNRAMLHMKKYKCPFCGVETETPVPVFSTLKPQSVALDGRIIYKDFDILRYTNIICHNCNYTDNYQEFGKPRHNHTPKNFSGNQFINAEDFSGYLNPLSRTLDEAIKSYYLNIACLTSTTESPSRFAKAWIRLYWLYSDYGRKSLSLDCAKRSLHHYTRYLSDSTDIILARDLLRLHATMGELCVALGDYEKAGEYYSANMKVRGAYDDDFVKKCKTRMNKIKRMK